MYLEGPHTHTHTQSTTTTNAPPGVCLRSCFLCRLFLYALQSKTKRQKRKTKWRKANLRPFVVRMYVLCTYVGVLVEKQKKNMLN